MGEFIWIHVSECFAAEAAFEVVELFRAEHLGVAVRGGEESIVHATITFDKLKRTKSGGILQIDFETHLARWSAVIPSAQQNFWCLVKFLLHPFVIRSIVIRSSITQLLTVSQEYNKEIHWVHFCFHWPSGLLWTKLKANYQTSSNIAGILMTELLPVPKLIFVKRWMF